MDMGTQPVRRLIRRTDNKVVAGVAAGLGDYFGIDPVWFRIGFVVAAFFGGFGVLAYAVFWVAMPEASGGPMNPAERGLERVAYSIRSTPSWIGVALVVLGGILLLNVIVDWRPGVIWGVALIVLGGLFFVQKEHEKPQPRLPVPTPGSGGSTPGDSTPVPPGVAGLTDSAVLERPGGPVPPHPPTIPTGAVPPPPPPVRERSTLGFMTFGVLLVAIGIVTLLDVQDVVTFEPVQYLAMALGIIGVGLLVGSVVGRARWLIVPGLILIPFTLAVSLIHVPFEGGFGERRYRPTGIPAIVQEYHLIAGDMTIDLTELEIPGPFKIEATTVAGHILIIVPDGESLDIEAKTGAGQVDLFGNRQEGVNISMHRTYNLATVEGTGDPLPATIEIDVEAGLGQIEVRSS